MIEKRNTKTQSIMYRQVLRAYESIKDNGKGAGVDNISLRGFKKDKEKQLYKIWNRMSSGSYFPPPVKEVEIDKKGGGVRKLGLPTVADRVAQMVVKHQIGARFEKIFHDDSYGYRPKRNAHDAIEPARERCLQFDWGIDLDIKGFFDNIDHELLRKCLERKVTEKWAMLYINRWLETPVVSKEGKTLKREKGTPQGGVISPLLANIFLHYVFDKWMEKHHPGNKFERYADDIIIHCNSKEEAEKLLDDVRNRMQECKLELHPDKTKVFYCKDYRRKESHKVDVSFTFLGHTFKPRKHKSKFGNSYYQGFSPAISIDNRKAKIQKIKEMYKQFFVLGDLERISEYVNPIVRGWLSYYGRVNKWKLKPVMDMLNFRLAKYLKRAFKRYKYSLGKAYKSLKKLKRKKPEFFVHWKHYAI